MKFRENGDGCGCCGCTGTKFDLFLILNFFLQRNECRRWLVGEELPYRTVYQLLCGLVWEGSAICSKLKHF